MPFKERMMETHETKTPETVRYLEDLQVGQRFHSATHTITADEIKVFAYEFDPQPFHLCEASARTSIFGSLAASGWHTAALTMRLLVTSGLPIDGGLIGRGGEIAWPRPTRPGDVLRVEAEVARTTPSRSKPDRGTATFEVRTFNQKHEVVQELTMNLMLPRRLTESQKRTIARPIGRLSVSAEVNEASPIVQPARSDVEDGGQSARRAADIAVAL
jgi:acyl dehydratase